jgi:predicted Zn-dependent protease
LWIGRLLLELGRPDEAIPYLRSLRSSLLEIPASYTLARAYEAAQDYEHARETYTEFAAAWSEADPELRPMVEEARAAAARLTSAIRE